MTEESAFLRAVIDRPDDDLPRLVYAEWLDENGDGERAEFIRAGCELAGLPEPEILSLGLAKNLSESEVELKTCRECRKHGRRCRWHYLCRRERELIQAESVFWGSGLPFPAHPDRGYCVWRRGFVESITCPAMTFLEHCHTIRNACPIVEVTLTGDVDPDWFRRFLMISGQAEGEGVRLCEGRAELGIVPLVWELHATSDLRRSEWGRKLFLDLLHAEFRGVSFRLADSVTVRDGQVRGGSVFPLLEPRAFVTGRP